MNINYTPSYRIFLYDLYFYLLNMIDVFVRHAIIYLNLATIVTIYYCFSSMVTVPVNKIGYKM